MHTKARLTVVALATGLFIAYAPRTFAQSASTSMHGAGENMENAGTSTGAAAINTYRGTKTATEDTAITTKVKSALLADDGTKSLHIHVKTVDGVVTLRGVVPSRALADQAQHVTETTGGVKEVRNRLRVETPTAAD